MRSCSTSAQACNSSAVSGLAPPLKVSSRPVFSTSRYSVTRSTRCSVAPQLWAMSVAFEAHGDSVPSRGITTISSPSGLAV